MTIARNCQPFPGGGKVNKDSKAQLEVGVIGLGLLGSSHTRFLQDRPEVTVNAVADIRGERARTVAEAYGAQPYTDYRRMLKERRLDVVVVATPDPLHKEPVIAALQAGVPAIILEKPMATAVEDANEMLEAAEGSGGRIFVNFANRGSPFDRATYYVIRQGLLGEVVYGDMRLDDHICVPTRLWGDRSREWVGRSSTAHFLLSHIVDLLHWVLAPATVTEVYAISQNRVLGYTPDLFDAFLSFDNGAKFRVKAEWIKHIDSLVEFKLSFSGSEGTLTYVKLPGFSEREGWRANLSQHITPEQLVSHQEQLLRQGINVRALLHRPNPMGEELERDGPEPKLGLEALTLPRDSERLLHAFIDATLEDSLTPTSWMGYGSLPTAIDGLQQTRVVCAIVESAESGKVVEPTRG
jgi:predicted dehydrogenase